MVCESAVLPREGAQNAGRQPPVSAPQGEPLVSSSPSQEAEHECPLESCQQQVSCVWSKDQKQPRAGPAEGAPQGTPERGRYFPERSGGTTPSPPSCPYHLCGSALNPILEMTHSTSKLQGREKTEPQKPGPAQGRYASLCAQVVADELVTGGARNWKSVSESLRIT